MRLKTAITLVFLAFLTAHAKTKEIIVVDSTADTVDASVINSFQRHYITSYSSIDYTFFKNGAGLSFPVRYIPGSAGPLTLYYDFRGFTFNFIPDVHNGNKLNCSMDFLLVSPLYGALVVGESRLLTGIALLLNGAIVLEKPGAGLTPRIVLGNSFHPFLLRETKWVQQDLEIAFEVGTYKTWVGTENVPTQFVNETQVYTRKKVCHDRLLSLRLSLVTQIDHIGRPNIQFNPRLTLYRVVW